MSQEEINKQNGELIERRRALRDQVEAQRQRLIGLAEKHRLWSLFLLDVAHHPEKDIPTILPAPTTEMEKQRMAVQEYVEAFARLKETDVALGYWTS